MGDDIDSGLLSMSVCFDFRSTNVLQLSNRRCLSGPNLNWFKSYGIKCKNAKSTKMYERKKHYINDFFLQNHGEMETDIFAFCVITFEPI